MTEEKNNYLDLLNPQQREAVTYITGPSLVIAGAGSGKTRVLTYKIVHLLHNGYEPGRIMALTFTNKAAREMKERISAIVTNKISSRIWMGTFHSIFLRILRNHADLLGYSHNFTIYDAADSKSLIKSIIKDLGYDEKMYKPSTISTIISNAKNALLSADQYCSDREYSQADARAKRPNTGLIYRIYSDRCRLSDAMDFDDILYYMNILLRDNPDILRHYQEYFKYVLVDEYQDTNFAQHMIISQLCAESKALCVVGDDAQSIYSFRGANIANILHLNNYYDNLKIFKLERNYRSTQNIINAASSLIEKNSQQIQKNVYSENNVGDRIEVIKSYSDMEESFLVANKITQLRHSEHDSYEDYAILYRTNAQSRILEESLRKRNIPYRIYGGLSFYQRKEIKDAICYFRLSINPNDDEALRRVINYPARGIGETTIKKIQSAAISNHISMWQVIQNADKETLNINSGTQKKLQAFANMIARFVSDNQSGLNAYELGESIYLATGILSSIAHDNTPESISKCENLQELLNGLKEFVEDAQTEGGEQSTSMENYLSYVSLATDQDENDDSDEKVTLMTVHAAKGLEFNNVIIVGVEEELFPSVMSSGSLAEIEEERRLLYVAITRAKRNCIITYAGSRFRNGMTQTTRPSRFISDINPKYLDLRLSSDIKTTSGYRENYFNPISQYQSNRYTHVSSTKSISQTNRGVPHHQSVTNSQSISPGIKSNDTHKASELKVGLRICHQRFGNGVITDIDYVSSDTTIIVEFDNVGTKKLLLRFAKFSIIN